jgi:hypothetical protein
LADPERAEVFRGDIKQPDAVSFTARNQGVRTSRSLRPTHSSSTRTRPSGRSSAEALWGWCQTYRLDRPCVLH